MKSERCVVFHRTTNGLNYGSAHVLLPTPELASAAISKVSGAPLFNRRIIIERAGISYLQSISKWPDWTWGWFASPTAEVSQHRTRGPLFAPPQDILKFIRQSRQMCIDNLPPKLNIRRDFKWLYPLFHSYNVEGISSFGKYPQTRSNAHLSGYLIFVVFNSKEELEHAKDAYNGYELLGRRLELSVSKPPKEYSWEQNKMHAGHNSGRDLGSAKGTRLEQEEEENFRKWVLKHNDRSLWI